MTFKNAISWFEIPAEDLDRAQKFYETIFDIEMIPMEMSNFKMRMFSFGRYERRWWSVML
jgi:predicted enzyme related to lactoylglutathione lyase